MANILLTIFEMKSVTSEVEVGVLTIPLLVFVDQHAGYDQCVRLPGRPSQHGVVLAPRQVAGLGVQHRASSRQLQEGGILRPPSEDPDLGTVLATGFPDTVKLGFGVLRYEQFQGGDIQGQFCKKK